MSVFDSVVPDAPETDAVSDPGGEDFATLREKIFGGRRKPSKSKPRKSSTDEITAKELEEVFAGENWEEVAALYFNARFAITGFDGFLLSDGQKKTLGLSLATTMKMLLKIDPGYVALIVFTANFGGLIAQKEMVYKQMVKRAEDRDRKKTAAN